MLSDDANGAGLSHSVATSPAERPRATESARLESLRALNILDTPQEPAFDELADLASSVCQTPVALVSLVDADRQWFKARVGLDIESTSREVSFCARAIETPQEMLVVPDASRDERFATNPLVVGPPGIRFYAGVPLTTRAGHSLGTLCVIDWQPRELVGEQRAALQTLGRQVASHLELRRINLELRQAVTVRDEALAALDRLRLDLERQVEHRTAQLTGTLDRIRDGFVAIDADWRFSYVNQRGAELLGRPLQALVGHGVWDLFPEAVDGPFREACYRASRDQATVEVEAFSDPVGRWFHARIYPAPDGLSAFFTDTTDIRNAQQAAHESHVRLRTAVHASQTGLWDWDLATNRVYFSPEWKRQLGYDEHELDDRFEVFEERLHPDDRVRVLEATRHFLEHATLSDREFDVLKRIGSGATVGEIATTLSLSVKTVSGYRANVLRKLGLSNNAELMKYVLDHGLLD